MRVKDAVVGVKVGMLTILKTEYVQKSSYKKLFATCLCACGAETTIQVNSLGGNTESCGCDQGSAKRVHGMTGTLAHKAWRGMRARCKSDHPDVAPHYRDRGISVCPEWDNFENFYKDMGDKPEGLTLERVNNDLGYSKSNCVWATKDAQERNKTTNVYVTHPVHGRLIFKDACRLEDIDVQCATSRLRKGKSLQTALANPDYSWHEKDKV